MAYRRSITARTKQFYEQYRVAPSFPMHIHRDDDNHENLPHNRPISNNPQIPNYFQRRLFGTGNNFGTFHGSRNVLNDRRFSIPAACGPAFVRNMSRLGKGPADNIEIMTDVADVLDDKAVEVAAQVGPMVNEMAVAVAAAGGGGGSFPPGDPGDSFLPVAILEHLINYVHIYTGFNWWASIVLTTILIRLVELPLKINQIKSTSKFTLLRPRLEEIKEDMNNRDMSPTAVAEGQARMKELFKEYGVTWFTPLKGLLISGPIFGSFFFAVKNMAEKVPSFQEGGAFWFTDLTTPDSMLILPVLTALSFWITVECNAREGMEGNPAVATMKNVLRAFAVLAIPLTATLPKAIFFYFITSNLFSLTYGLALKKPEVKKLLGIQIIPVSPPSSMDQKPAFSFFEALKKDSAAQQHQSSSPSEVSLKPETNQRISSSSVLNQRITSLEREVKGQQNGKTR